MSFIMFVPNFSFFFLKIYFLFESIPSRIAGLAGVADTRWNVAFCTVSALCSTPVIPIDYSQCNCTQVIGHRHVTNVVAQA